MQALNSFGWFMNYNRYRSMLTPGTSSNSYPTYLALDLQQIQARFQQLALSSNNSEWVFKYFLEYLSLPRR